DGEPAPKDERARLCEIPPDSPERVARGWPVQPGDEPDWAESEPRRPQPTGWQAAHDEPEDAAREEHPHDLAFRPRGDDAGDAEDRPEKRVPRKRPPDELPDASSDDCNHGCADAVERSPHPPEAAVLDVSCRQREHHEERRQDEREDHERGTEHPGTDPPQVDGELRGERSRRELCEGQPLLVVFRRDPAAPFDEVTLHVTNERDGPAEAHRAQTKEVEEQLAQRARSATFGCRLINLELESRGRHFSRP